jgi:hypothetical protein
MTTSRRLGPIFLGYRVMQRVSTPPMSPRAASPRQKQPRAKLSGKPWQAQGISRAAWYRRRRVRDVAFKNDARSEAPETAEV